MPAKPKAKKTSKASGVPAKPDHPEDTPAPARDPRPAPPAATTATAGTAPAMSTPGGKPTPNGRKPAGGKTTEGDVTSAGGKDAAGGKGKATAAVADALEDSQAEPDAATSDEEEPPANPLEALRRAQAKRVPPPGTQPRFGGSGTRGGNPSAPRHYNRHK